MTEMTEAEYNRLVADCPRAGFHKTCRHCAICPICPWTETGWQDPDRWKPRYQVRKSPHVGGDPIPEDEPCLVIRAQDQLATATLSAYIARYRRLPNHSREVVNELFAHLEQLVIWQDTHRDQIKTADR